MNKKGFTLMELLIVLAIIVIMVMMLVGILNPIALINKAGDAQRKKDLRRIAIAFEDHFNDKNCYPDTNKVAELTNKAHCRSGTVFDPWLAPWPCDPHGNSYQISVGGGNCPKWFKILTKLENKNDKDVRLDLGIDAGEIGYNYGVSSGNISFGGYPGDTNGKCNFVLCYHHDINGICNTTESGSCNDDDCYRGNCEPECQVSCCGDGCN